jgi:translation initiation factor IF-2
LSTRVHELAKELGLKSQELLERIQKWGLDVKANALASLDPPMVDRIRELMDQPAGGTAAKSPAAPHRPAPAPPTVAPRVSGGAEGARPPGPAVPGPGAPTQTRPVAGGAGPTASPPTTFATPTAAPQRLIPGSSPSASARPPASTGPTAPVSPSGPRPAPAAPTSAPLSRPGGFSGTRPAGGPLSAHTTHRGAGPRPANGAKARSAVFPGIVLARFGIGGVPTSETRRLHVVGGDPPSDSEDRSIVAAIVVGTASARWRARGRRRAPRCRERIGSALT